MSTPDAPPGQQKYYDPAEVEAYVADVTNTIKTLQARLHEAVRRADQAGQPSGELHPETASLGRALLLAGEVADKTIADADARAAEIIRVAERRAAAIVEAAHIEAQRVIESAEGAAAEVFQKGEARLLAAVSAFVEGSNVLRSALARIEEDATSWRSPGRPPPTSSADRQRSDSVAFTPPPLLHSTVEALPTEGPAPEGTVPPDPAGAVLNRAGRNGYRPAHPSVTPVDRSPRAAPPSGGPLFGFPPPGPGGPA